MATLPTFTIEAYYENGSVQAREQIQAPDAITALNRATHFTCFLAGDVRSNTLRSDLMVSRDGGPLVSVMDLVAASMRRAAA